MCKISWNIRNWTTQSSPKDNNLVLAEGRLRQSDRSFAPPASTVVWFLSLEFADQGSAFTWLWQHNPWS